jgi:hypothetical protein
MDRTRRARAFGKPLLVLALAASGFAACVGEPNETPAQPQCDVAHIAPTPLRRLTAEEYGRTVHDLLGADPKVTVGFARSEGAVTLLVADQLQHAAETVAADAVSTRLSTLVPCDPKAGDEACARSFVASFGKRAYRRPLDHADIDRHIKLYATAAAQGGFAAGIQLVIEAMLQSPSFLYKVELGMPSAGDAAVPLSQYEIATRLSYLLWGTMPDQELFAAADAGKLATGADVGAQARRMLADARARDAIRSFHRNWLGLEALDAVNKDQKLYPGFKGATLRRETEAFVEHVIFDGAGDLRTLLTAPYTMMNRDVATHYGIKGPAGDALVRVDLDPARHAGIVTQGGWLSLAAKPDATSPVLRGKHVLERFMCRDVLPQPQDVPIILPDVDPNATLREKFAQHTADPQCKACHVSMDPLGFAFEHYDAVGRWRDKENGLPIDATATIVGSRDMNGPIDGAVALARKLGDSEQVRECVVNQWFRYAYGRPEQVADRCTLDELGAKFAGSDYRIQDLIVALTETAAFRYRPQIGKEGSP